MEEMESYVKLHKSLASKSRGRKGSSSKASSSPRPSAPVGSNVSDVDACISSQFALFSQEFDKKLETVSEGILSKFRDFVSFIIISMQSLSYFPLVFSQGVLGRLINPWSPGVERNIGFLCTIKCHPDSKG